MTRIELEVTNATAKKTAFGRITAGMRGLTVHVTFDDAWNGLVPTLIAAGAVARPMAIDADGNSEVPWECLVSGYVLKLGVRGINESGEVVIPTSWADCGIVERSVSDADIGDTPAPSPDLVDQIQRLAFQADDKATNALHSAGDAVTTANGAKDAAEGYRDSAKSYAEQASASSEASAYSAQAAANSAKSAASSASAADNSAKASLANASASRISATNAENSASAAAASASSASTSATRAESARTSAQTAATNAGVQARNAQTSATNAANSAKDAATAKTAAEAAQAGAEASQAAAETAQGKAEVAQSGAEAAKSEAERIQREIARDYPLVPQLAQEVNRAKEDLATLYSVEEHIGKNKYNYESAELGHAISSSGNVVIDTTGKSVSAAIKLPENAENAVISYVGSNGSQAIVTSTTISAYYYSGEATGADTFISPPAFGNHAIPAGAKYVRLSLHASYTSARERVQYEIGTEMTPFEQYKIITTEGGVVGDLSSKVDRLIGNFEEPKSLFALLNNGEHHQIKLLGDSITHGVGGTGFAQNGEDIIADYKRNPNGYCWANLFKASLEAQFDCTVLNNACRGTRTKYAVDNWDTLVSSDDDIIIVMYGTNDRLDSNNTDLLKGYYKALKAKADASNKHIFFICCIPSARSIENGQNPSYVTRFTMRDVDRALSEVTGGNYYSLYTDVIEYMSVTDLADVTSKLSADGLHPNDYLYNKMYVMISHAFGIPVSINSIGFDNQDGSGGGNIEI